jgi:hypothetical protein
MDGPRDQYNMALAMCSKLFQYQIRCISKLNRSDCAMSMLTGIDKLLKDNPNLSPQMLAEGKLQEYLKPPAAFSYTGYMGLNKKNFSINRLGDVDNPISMTMWNASMIDTFNSASLYGGNHFQINVGKINC